MKWISKAMSMDREGKKLQDTNIKRLKRKEKPVKKVEEYSVRQEKLKKSRILEAKWWSCRGKSQIEVGLREGGRKGIGESEYIKLF